MTKKIEIPSGYVSADEAAGILGMSKTAFDRLAPKVFPACRIGIKNAYFYPVSELEAYRNYLKKCKETSKSPLTWAEMTQMEPAVLLSRVNVLKWLLSPAFPADENTQSSAAWIQRNRPGDYERAKRILNEIGLDLEALRQRLAFPLSDSSLYPEEEPPYSETPIIDGDVYF